MPELLEAGGTCKTCKWCWAYYDTWTGITSRECAHLTPPLTLMLSEPCNLWDRMEE